MAPENTQSCAYSQWHSQPFFRSPWVLSCHSFSGKIFFISEVTRPALREWQVLTAECPVPAGPSSVPLQQLSRCLSPLFATQADQNPWAVVIPDLSCATNDSNAGREIQEKIGFKTLLGYFVLFYWGKPFFSVPQDSLQQGSYLVVKAASLPPPLPIPKQEQWLLENVFIFSPVFCPCHGPWDIQSRSKKVSDYFYIITNAFPLHPVLHWPRSCTLATTELWPAVSGVLV